MAHDVSEKIITWRNAIRAPFERLLQEAMERKQVGVDTLHRIILELGDEIGAGDVYDFVYWFFIRWAGLKVAEYEDIPFVGINDHRFTSDERVRAEDFLQKRLDAL